MLQEQARKFVLKIGQPDFKVSDGWLQQFKGRHNITGTILSGKRASVDGKVVDDWQARLPNLTAGYNARDIYNMAETLIVYRALPDRSFAV